MGRVMGGVGLVWLVWHAQRDNQPPSPHATPLRYALVATVSRTPPVSAAVTSLPEIWGGRMGEGGSRPRTCRPPWAAASPLRRSAHSFNFHRQLLPPPRIRAVR